MASSDRHEAASGSAFTEVVPDSGATPVEEIVEAHESWCDEGTTEIPASYEAKLKEEMVDPDPDPTIRMSAEEVKRLCKACRG